MPTARLKAALAALVVVHVLVALVHGAAHRGAHVDLAPAALDFVIAVILIGPLAGLGLAIVAPRAGAAVVAVTMAGALLFGVINHFVVRGADHVGAVDAQWRTLFGVTAFAIAVLEAGGTVLGVLVFALESGRQQR